MNQGLFFCLDLVVEKYFSLVRIDENKPIPTLTATESTSSAASIVHPREKRKLVVSEAKRCCSFPDDFKTIGKVGEQKEGFGRAVPPLLMCALSSQIKKVLDIINERKEK